MKRKIDKHLVEEMARINRKYAITGDVDILDKRSTIADRMSIQAFGTDREWMSFCDLFSALCGVAPLKQCTNAEIIFILNYLGFEVVESEEKTE